MKEFKEIIISTLSYEFKNELFVAKDILQAQHEALRKNDILDNKVRKLAKITQRPLMQINSMTSLVVPSILKSSEEMITNKKLSRAIICVKKKTSCLRGSINNTIKMQNKVVDGCMHERKHISSVIDRVRVAINEFFSKSLESIEGIIIITKQKSNMIKRLNNKLLELKT